MLRTFAHSVLAAFTVSPPTLRAITTHLIAVLITLAGLYDMLINKAMSGPLIDLTYAVVVAYIGIHGVAVGAKATNLDRESDQQERGTL